MTYLIVYCLPQVIYPLYCKTNLWTWSVILILTVCELRSNLNIPRLRWWKRYVDQVMILMNFCSLSEIPPFVSSCDKVFVVGVRN